MSLKYLSKANHFIFFCISGYNRDGVISNKEVEQVIFALNAGRGDASTNLKLIIVNELPMSYQFTFRPFCCGFFRQALAPEE